MKHESRSPAALANTRPHRTTGVQVATRDAAALLAGWREVFSPREYAVVLDLMARQVDRERKQVEAASRRWAA